MNTHKTDEWFLKLALIGAEHQAEEIAIAIKVIKERLAGDSKTVVASLPAVATKTTTKRKKRRLSAAGLKAIQDASKRRWTAIHAAQKTGKKLKVVKAA